MVAPMATKETAAATRCPDKGAGLSASTKCQTTKAEDHDPHARTDRCSSTGERHLLGPQRGHCKSENEERHELTGHGAG
jgi:hypothetical protein